MVEKEFFQDVVLGGRQTRGEHRVLCVGVGFDGEEMASHLPVCG